MRLGGLLENMYFHELEMREKIFVRLQLNFAAYVTIVTIVVYMAKTVDFTSPYWAVTIFCSLLFSALIPLIISITYTLIAFTGYRYVIFPGATRSVSFQRETEKYFTNIPKTHAEQADFEQVETRLSRSEKEVSDFILDSLAESVDKNSQINEQRKLANRKSLMWLFVASMPLGIAASLFVLLDLDASSPRKNFPIEDSKLRGAVVQTGDKIERSISQLTKEIAVMSNQNTPPSGSSPTDEQQIPVSVPEQTGLIPPKRPPMRISNENFSDPLLDKSQLKE